jgi:histidyl-tRNA synthetase
MLDFFALRYTPWSEYSQAKWDMRRMLGDLGHGVESSVYTMSDFRHNGAEIHSPNNKGLIRVNDRRILKAMSAACGFAADKFDEICIVLDKLDKIGLDNVNAELKEKGLSDEAIATLQPLLALDGTNEERLASLSGMLSASETGMKGIEEMRYVLDHVAALGTRANVELDVSLARGLNYYTGTILEVKALDVAIGSITGGGRYDNLTGVFGMPGLSGVGISFGADRIYDVLNALDLYPADTMATARVMFVNFGEQEATASLKHIMALRRAGISAELYPDSAKMKKQMNYANDRKIPFVAIVGADEVNNGTIALKNMATGEQQTLTVDQVIEHLAK